MRKLFQGHYIPVITHCNCCHCMIVHWTCYAFSQLAWTGRSVVFLPLVSPVRVQKTSWLHSQINTILSHAMKWWVLYCSCFVIQQSPMQGINVCRQMGPCHCGVISTRLVILIMCNVLGAFASWCVISGIQQPVSVVYQASQFVA